MCSRCGGNEVRACQGGEARDRGSSMLAVSTPDTKRVVEYRVLHLRVLTTY